MTADTTPPRILIVDDDIELCELLDLRFAGYGFVVRKEHNVSNATRALETDTFDVVLLDLRLGSGNGLDVLKVATERTPHTPVIVLTAHGSVKTAVDAMRAGAFGFLLKPFSDHELKQQVDHAVESARLRTEVAGLRQVVDGTEEDSHIIGTAPAIRQLRDILARVADTEATVLLLGESGTGKELAARTLHKLSRKPGPFVAVNCAAITPTLLESTLFGHTKGSFTGATRDSEGLFGAARKGTLLLDEVGEASLEVQAKLLRVLEERRFTKVGSTLEEETDARVVAATNRDLRQEVNEKRFREDLYYRLHVVPVTLPPLREREDDVPFLAELFLKRAAARHKRPTPELSALALSALKRHGWPGNVRELANVMEAAVLLARDGIIEPEQLPGVGVGGPAGESVESFERSVAAVLARYTGEAAESLPPLREARDAFERAYLELALKRADGNVSLAAKQLGRNRTDLYDLLRRHNLQASDFKR